MHTMGTLIKRYFAWRERDFETPNPDTLRRIQRGA